MKLLTINEVSEMLRTSPNTINYWTYQRDRAEVSQDWPPSTLG